METTLSNLQIEVLASFIGEEFELIGGESLPEFLMSSSISVFTKNRSVKIFGKVVDGDFEGFDNEYSIFGVSENTPKVIEDILASGNTYNNCQGQTIQDVHIVREMITEFTGQSSTWSLISDVAIVFELTDSAIVISFLSHNTEALRATFAESVNLESVPATGNDFDDDLQNSYEFKRQIFSISEKELR